MKLDSMSALVSLLIAAVTALCLVFTSASTVLATIALFAYIALLIRCPLQILPTVALVVFLLFPLQYLPVESLNTGVSPTLIACVILFVRHAVRGDRLLARGLAVPAAILGCWVAMATLLSDAPSSSAIWSANFAVLVLVPILVLTNSPEASLLLEKAFAICGSILGIYGIVEFSLQQNPLLDSLYLDSPARLSQDWDIYRITTTLGHPLMNGLYFSVASIVSLGLLLRRPTAINLTSFALTAGATVASGSRGSLVALGISAAFLLLLAAFDKRTAPNRFPLVLAAIVICCAGVFAANVIGDRVGGEEAQGSTRTRLSTYEVGFALAQQEAPLGAGPGLSDALKRASPLGDSRRGIESSWLQIAISLGIPGVAGFALLLIFGIFYAIRNRPPVAAALVCYTISVATFNVIEANRAALVLLGLLLGLAACPLRDHIPAPKKVVLL